MLVKAFVQSVALLDLADNVLVCVEREGGNRGVGLLGGGAGGERGGVDGKAGEGGEGEGEEAKGGGEVVGEANEEEAVVHSTLHAGEEFLVVVEERLHVKEVVSTKRRSGDGRGRGVVAVKTRHGVPEAIVRRVVEGEAVCVCSAGSVEAGGVQQALGHTVVGGVGGVTQPLEEHEVLGIAAHSLRQRRHHHITQLTRPCLARVTRTLPPVVFREHTRNWRPEDGDVCMGVALPRMETLETVVYFGITI